MITDEELVNEIKKRLGITGTHHDLLLLAYANDTKEFMHSAGIPAEVVDSEASVGLISRGVADLWNLGSGQGVFSGFFKQRIAQMYYTNWGSSGDSTDSAIGFSALTTDELDNCLGCLYVDSQGGVSGGSGTGGSGSSGTGGSTSGGSSGTGTGGSSGTGGSGVIYTPMTDEEIDSCTGCLKD
jgi:hypothetical protein